MTNRIDVLTAENQLLRNDNARLRSIINNDSSNTSLPPSTDLKGGKPANTYNGRQKSERKVGGQKGRKGTTLTKADVEEKIKEGNCNHKVINYGNKKTKRYISKYLIDLEVSTVITERRFYANTDGSFTIPKEYRSDVVYGPNVKALAVTLYSEGVMANDRIASFLNASSGDTLNLSNGSIYHFCKKLSNEAKSSIEVLETELLNESVTATDATVVTVNGEQHYIRNFSIQDTVIYRALKSKSINMLETLEFLKNYAGTLVHDHETALYHFGTDHAECNVHILRYLKKNVEETQNTWSSKLITLLCDANKARKEKIQSGKNAFLEEEVAAYESKYAELIQLGKRENKATKHKYAKSDEKTLLNRLEKYQRNHLLFLHNFSVPFDNNISERDLRKVKNRQKMSGGFRKESGLQMYCSILTIVETLKKRKMPLIENLKQLFMGTPAIF